MCFTGTCKYESYEGECFLKLELLPIDSGCVQNEMETVIKNSNLRLTIKNVLGDEDELGRTLYSIIINEIANCHYHNPITTEDMLPALMRLSIIKEKLNSIQIKSHFVKSYHGDEEYEIIEGESEKAIRTIIKEAW
jgi:hypothetical protein